MSVSENRLKSKYGFEYPFKRDPLAERALDYIKNGNQLLDVGCGEGADSVSFAKKGFQVTAIDNNKIYLDRLKEFISDKGITNISIKCGDVIDYPYHQNFYDVINCLLVGCCMKRSDFERLLITLKQAIKASGIIIMSLRNYLDPEFTDFAATETMIEPNTFRKKEKTVAKSGILLKKTGSGNPFQILRFYITMKDMPRISIRKFRNMEIHI